MSARTATWLAWSLWLLYMALALGAVIFLILGWSTPPPASFGFRGFSAIVAVPFSTVGALIASRRPQNSIGWIFCAIGLGAGLYEFAWEYAIYAVLALPGPLPGGEVMAWFTNWIWVPLNRLVWIFLFLLFPDGHLLSPRWRVASWIGAAGIAVASFGFAFDPGPLTSFSPLINPFGIEAAGSLLVAVGNTGFTLMVIAGLASVASLVLRYRRSRGDERQQLKWLTYAAMLVAVAVIVAFPFIVVRATSGELPLVPLVVAILMILSVAGIPIAAGIAILKYRLYDIDLIIHRTLVYVPLTAILTGVYTASIGLSQMIFVAITGEESDAAIVFTTLVVVSAFTPVKNGLQSIVDKRFKEVPDPTKELRNFGEQVRSFVQLSDSQQITRRVLEEAVRAFQAEGGAVFLYKNGQPQLVHTVGKWKGETKISVPLESDKTQYGFVALGARKSGLDYTPQDREALQQIVSLVAQAIRLAERAKSNLL